MLTPEIEDAGAFAILSKPVSLEQLYAALYSVGPAAPAGD
jgi:hypothetical protein